MSAAVHWREVDMPRRIAALRRNGDGYPVPWFVAWIDGKPDFRVIAPGKILQAVKYSRCWLCGGLLMGTPAFVIGPMCAVNRVSAEPPSHPSCATYAARVCPFLTNPKKERRDTGKPEDAAEPAGVMLTRNPGVALVWCAPAWTTFDAPGGALFHVGEPSRVEWWAEGREATRDEVVASIESGYPTHVVQLVGTAEQIQSQLNGRSPSRRRADG